MKYTLSLKKYIQLSTLLFIAPFLTNAQCEIFKSDLLEVTNYMEVVSQLSDSLQSYSEVAAYSGKFETAKKNARSVEALIGQALNSADEAVLLVSDVQYYSEICGIDKVITNTINTESNSIDARDFAEEAYVNTKNALKAKNLGNLHYYMRKAQRASIEARNSADIATLAANMAHSQCTHVKE